MAASMLRHGHHPTRVAAVTDVPLALVQLIADNLPPGTGHHRRPPFPRTADPPQCGAQEDDGDPTDHRWDAIAGTHTAQLRRRRIRVLQSAVICAAVNAAITAVAVQTHQGAVTVACLILAPLIYTAVLLLLVLPPRPRGPEPHPR
jgi:hypothetical protein